MSQKTPLSDVSLIGLGTMGSALARNIESKGYRVCVYNRSTEKTKQFIHKFGTEKFDSAKTLKELVQKTKTPRNIIIMVKDGAPVDAIIKNLKPHIQKGDVLIDGGNSHYQDTIRREAELETFHIDYIGCGISGGEQGALEGPSLMPGGKKSAYKKIKNILQDIAAKDFSGKPCVTYVGEQGAGHYVKMVHNGIEYAIMQMIAETYDFLRNCHNMNPVQVSEIFKQLNRGKLNSYLLSITLPVLQKTDPLKRQQYLIDSILDKASNKGTGKWTSLDALNRGIAIPSITQAVYARYISAQKQQRSALHKMYRPVYKKAPRDQKHMVSELKAAFHAASISCYAQGYDLIHQAAKQEQWKVNLSEISRIWEGGCIIRSKLLVDFHQGYKQHKKISHLFELPVVQKNLIRSHKKLKKLVCDNTQRGISLPAYSSALHYINSMTQANLPANMIQGLRDYFGAHTYERIDKKGNFHTEW